MAALIHSFSAAPGNAGPGQQFTLETAGRYVVVADPPGSVTSLDWLASAPTKPERWVRWQPFNPNDGDIYVTAKAAPQTFRLEYGDGGAVVIVYFED